MNSYSAALNAQIYLNSNLTEGTPTYELYVFMPHPHTWKRESEERTVKITRATAIEFLQSYRKFNPQIEALFDDWLSEIKLIASGV